MAIDAITAAAAALLGLGLYGRAKKRKKQAATSQPTTPEVIPKTPLVLAEC